VKTHRDLPATVFFGVGALEETQSDPMVSNVSRLESLLSAAHFPGLTLIKRVFPEESHLMVWSTNLIQGLVAVFGRPGPDDTFIAKYRAQQSQNR
jgi:hypothetical protein